jgi:long-chain fatty acid transport protein
MKMRLLFTFVALVVAATSVYPNGLSLNSIGPKGFGMGGAFVGLANDYTAIYWNPAGLTQIQKNFVGAFLTDIVPMATWKYAPAAIDAKTKTNHYLAPNLMGSFRFNFSDKLTLGLGVFVPAGIGTEWDGNELKNLSAGTVLEWMSKIGVINIAPAAAYKVTDQLSLGVAINILYGMFDLKNPVVAGGHGYQYSETSNGWGYGVTIGALYKAADNFSFGASFKTKSKVKMSGTAKNPAMAGVPTATESDFDRDVEWPMWIAGGIAFRPIETLVITADVQFSRWSESEDEFVTTYKNATWMAIMTPSNDNKLILHWKDATQIRFGIGYSVNENLDIRAGYYIDPAPAPSETYSILFPSISYNVITLGAGYTISNFVVDIAGEYLIGKDRDIASLTNPDATPGTHGMNILAWSFGIGYMF